MKIQFYPQTLLLEQSILAEVKEKNISIEELMNNIMNERYGINQGGLTKAELFEKVESEVSEFVLNPNNEGKEFTIHQASETARNISQHYNGRPNAVRAVIGKRMGQLFGVQEPFLNVKPVILETGKQKLSTGNRAAVYRICKKEDF